MSRSAALLLAALVACRGAPPPPDPETPLQAAAAALREGRIEAASETVAAVRQGFPSHAEAAAWSAFLADLQWRDADAIAEQRAALRQAERDGAPAATLLARRGRLGELLFQAGRWGDAQPHLEAAGAAEHPDAARWRAFAALAPRLPFARAPSGPLLTEQRLLPGHGPEFLCGSGAQQRPFAIDTGTSMTTLSRSFAGELGVRGLTAAGTAIDGTGRALPVEVGVLDQFRVGDVDLGAVPVLVVDDAALRLRDLFGGPERAPQGVLGLDLLAAFRLTLDPERQSVVLELPRGLAEADSVPCLRAAGRCLLPLQIEGVRLWFVLDTGASHSSLTPLGARALPGGDDRAVPSFRRVRTVGGGVLSVREVRDLVLRVDEARFRGVTLPVVPRGEPGAFPVHGVLGVDLLSRCRVTFDRGRARLVAVR